jgi:alpha-tubulin suppressor-like RCC1 family protein
MRRPVIDQLVWLAIAIVLSCRHLCAAANLPQPGIISAGEFHTCGIKRDGSVACWGDNGFGQASPPAGTFIQITAGGRKTCGIRRDGTVACWGNNYDGQATPPAGTFIGVSAGENHTCGVKTDGNVICWGSYGSGAIRPSGRPIYSGQRGRRTQLWSKG